MICFTTLNDLVGSGHGSKILTRFHLWSAVWIESSTNFYHFVIAAFCTAPEVLKSKSYNRSLDMWSVGVIMYVRSVTPF